MINVNLLWLCIISKDDVKFVGWYFMEKPHSDLEIITRDIYPIFIFSISDVNIVLFFIFRFSNTYKWQHFHGTSYDTQNMTFLKHHQVSLYCEAQIQ